MSVVNGLFRVQKLMRPSVTLARCLLPATGHPSHRTICSQRGKYGQPCTLFVGSPIFLNGKQANQIQRHFIKTQSQNMSKENRYALLQRLFEFNPKHPIIKKLHKLTTSDPELAKLLAKLLAMLLVKLLVKLLLSQAMVGAGLVDDPRMLLTSMYDWLQKVLDKH